jgi:DNA-binding transcriptional ArsR family regulator
MLKNTLIKWDQILLMNGPYEANIKRVLWYVLAGTKGGLTRIKIIELLRNRPYNTNQMSEELKMDYKTIQHHIKVLEDNRIITYEKKKYGTMYFTSQMFNQYSHIYEEIKKKIKKE